MAAAAMVSALEPPARGDTAEAAQNEIRAALARWQSAFNDRDEEHLCDIFAGDVVANYDGEPERDYGSLCEMLRTAVQDQKITYHYSVTISEILVYGETALARLVWKLEIDKPGAPKELVEEPAIDIFRREAEGDWKISRYLAYPPSLR